MRLQASQSVHGAWCVKLTVRLSFGSGCFSLASCDRHQRRGCLRLGQLGQLLSWEGFAVLKNARAVLLGRVRWAVVAAMLLRGFPQSAILAGAVCGTGWVQSLGASRDVQAAGVQLSLWHLSPAPPTRSNQCRPACCLQQPDSAVALTGSVWPVRRLWCMGVNGRLLDLPSLLVVRPSHLTCAVRVVSRPRWLGCVDDQDRSCSG